MFMEPHGKHAFLTLWTKISIACTLVCLLCLCAQGCDSKETTPTGSSGSDKSASPEKSERTTAQKQEDTQSAILDNVRHSLDLNRIGFSTDLQIIISMLNQWRNASSTADEVVTVPKRIETLIGKEAVPQFNISQFSPMDGLHLRDCVTVRAVATYAAGETRDELTRVLNLFQYVSRSIRLTSNHLGWVQSTPGQRIELPFTQYDTSLLGFGIAHDRAWLFSSLLRQFGIDSVILLPTAAPDDVKKGTDYFLVGVLLGKEVYLFDPYMGVPIPPPSAKGAATENRGVATLRQASTIPEVFRQLDPLPKVVYPLQAEQFKRPRVQLIGSLPLWSARMKRLQPQFSGKDSMTIYEALGDSPGQTGMFSRVGSAGGDFWNADTLELWSYPQQVLFAALRLQTPQGQGQLQIMSRLYMPLSAPMDWAVNAAKRQVELQQPKRIEQQARLAHLNGGFESALKLYIDVRRGAKKDPRLEAPPGLPVVLLQGQSEASDASQIVRIIFDRSDDDATYFTGLCQTDRGDYAAAAETFRKYLEYFARSRQQAELAIKQRATQQGLPEPPADVRQSLQQALAFRFFWINSVRYNLALNEVRLGHKSEAARILRAIPSTNPQYAGYLHSMQLWDPKIAAEARQEMQAKLDEVIKKVEDQQKPKENQKPAAATSGASAQPEKPTAAPDPKSPAVKEPTPKATPAAPAKSAAQPAVDSKSPAAATSKQGGTDPVVTPAPTKTVPPAKESSPPKK